MGIENADPKTDQPKPAEPTSPITPPKAPDESWSDFLGKFDPKSLQIPPEYQLPSS